MKNSGQMFWNSQAGNTIKLSSLAIGVPSIILALAMCLRYVVEG